MFILLRYIDNVYINLYNSMFLWNSKGPHYYPISCRSIEHTTNEIRNSITKIKNILQDFASDFVVFFGHCCAEFFNNFEIYNTRILVCLKLWLSVQVTLTTRNLNIQRASHNRPLMQNPSMYEILTEMFEILTDLF